MANPALVSRIWSPSFNLRGRLCAFGREFGLFKHQYGLHKYVGIGHRSLSGEAAVTQNFTQKYDQPSAIFGPFRYKLNEFLKVKFQRVE